MVVFDDVEILDFCGPFEVFCVTRINEERRMEEPCPFEVLLVAEKQSQVVTTGGMKVIPDHSFKSCPKLDILVVPGGLGTRREVKNQKLIDWLRVRELEVELLASVCTGSMLLGSAGLLDSRRATTHWAALDWMRESFPEVTVVHDGHVVEDDSVLTSAGISAGIDLALKTVDRCHGHVVARGTARSMEYQFPGNNVRRIDVTKK